MPPAEELRTTTPTRQESVDLLTDMVRFWDTRGNEVTIPVVDGSVPTGVAIQAQVEHSARLTEAVLLLVRQGLFIQVAPLVRMAMECAVSAAWWTLDPSNLKGSVEEAARLKRLLMNSLGGLLGKPNETHPDWVGLGEEYAKFSSNQAKSFEQRCNAIAGGASLYPYYRLLSESSHGGVAILDEYMTQIRATEEQPFGLAFLRHAPYKYLDGALAINSVVLALAFRAWDDCVPQHPDAATIDSFASRIGAEVVIARVG